MEIVDMTGTIGATHSTPKGAVLMPWNPDESWKRDALLRVNTVLKPPTTTHTVYEHVDVMVHPLGVHLVEAVASRFWEYFFPKEDAAVVERQKRWVKSVEPKARHNRKGSATSIPGASSDSEAGPAPPPSVFAGTAGPLESGFAGGATSAHTSPGSVASAPVAVYRPHRRIHSLDSTRLDIDPLKAPHTSADEVPGLVSGQSAWLDSVFRQQSESLLLLQPPPTSRKAHRKSASVDDATAAASGSEGPDKAEKKTKRKRKARQAQPIVRNVLFLHVRINRLHCRVTYQGYPISFSDFKMVLDNRVYRSLDGRWRDLFQHIKWDTIKSVLKSVAGLQGRKFKELLPRWEDRGDPEKKAVVVKSWIASLGGKKKRGESEEIGHGTGAVEALKEKAKSKLLLGTQHLNRSQGHGATLPTVYSGISESLSGQPSDLTVQMDTLPSGHLSSPEGTPSPSRGPQGPRSARQPSGMLLEEHSFGDSAEPRPRTAGSKPIQWGQDLPASKSGQPQEALLQSQGSSELPSRSGLELKDLLRSRGARTSNEEERVEGFSWGKDIPEARTAQPTAKAKAAKLFGRAGVMLKEAGSSVSSATSAVAHQAQAAAAKARAAQAEKRAAGGGESRRTLGSLLARQKKSSSPDTSRAGRVQSFVQDRDGQRAADSDSYTSQRDVDLRLQEPTTFETPGILTDTQRSPLDRHSMHEAAISDLAPGAPLEEPNAVVQMQEAPLIDLESDWEQPGIPAQSNDAGLLPSRLLQSADVSEGIHTGNLYGGGKVVESEDPFSGKVGSGNPFIKPSQSGNTERDSHKADDRFMDDLLDF